MRPEPWFEDVLFPYGQNARFGNNTNLVADMVGQFGYYYGFTGFLPANIGIPSQFGTNAFNVFNHPTFGTPAMNIVTNASNFGQISATATGLGQSSTNGGARVAQFSLRLEF